MNALSLNLLESRFAESIVALPSGARVAVRRVAASAGIVGGPTFVLLHGLASGAASWLHCALALSQSGGVVAWDAPGYGASTALAPAAPTAADYAERLLRTLQALGVERCVLVGHSLGALMAAACAKTSGASTVSRVVLVSPAGGYGAADKAGERARVRSRRHDDLRSLGIAGMARRAPERMLSPNADSAARGWVEWNAARLNVPGYLQAVELLCNADLARSSGLRMPVQVHCGAADAVTPPAACRAWAEVFSAPFALIDDAGHASPVEQPAAVARAIAVAAPGPSR